METKKVLVCLASGFEEAEAVVPVDYLRRSGAEVVLAGVDSLIIEGSHGVKITADIEIKDAEKSYDAVVCPGGMPGAVNLSKSWEVNSRLIETIFRGGIVAAICAAPAIVLGPAGLLKGKKAVCYPGMEKYWPDCKFSKERVIADGNILTARGAGIAEEFSLKLIEMLFGKEVAEKTAGAVLYE